MLPSCDSWVGSGSGMIVYVRDKTANQPDRSKRHAVAIVVYDGLATFEFGVACDVFGEDRSVELGVPWYRFSVCAATSGLLSADGGFKLQAPHGLAALRRADTVIVPPTD